ncbi:MAG: hypothetical protein ACK56F_22740, partial [bacterium]
IERASAGAGLKGVVVARRGREGEPHVLEERRAVEAAGWRRHVGTGGRVVERIRAEVGNGRFRAEVVRRRGIVASDAGDGDGVVVAELEAAREAVEGRGQRDDVVRTRSEA